MRIFNWFQGNDRVPSNGNGNGHSKKSYEVVQRLMVESTTPVNAAKEARDMVQSGEPEAQTYTVKHGEAEVTVDLSTEPPTTA